jgi:hypothetical protein
VHTPDYEWRYPLKAYEFPVKVTSEGELDIPHALTEILPRGEIVRMILLISEPTDVYEQAAWSRMAAEQFLSGYSEVDTIYDKKS